MNYQQMNEQLKDQLTRYGKLFETDTEIYEVQDFVEGLDKGASYHAYLTEQLNAYKEAKQAEVTELQARFYQSQVESMEQQQEQLTKPVSKLTRDEILELSPTEATRLRNKIGAEAYNSIMEGKKAPISQLLEEPSEQLHETYERYRGSKLTELSVSLATAIKNEAPSIYATLI